MNKLWEWTRVPHVPVELKAFLPMTSAVRITLGRGIQMITFVNTVPIDENRSVNRFCLIRNFAIDPAMDGFVRDNMMTILSEDKVSGVRPTFAAWASRDAAIVDVVVRSTGRADRFLQRKSSTARFAFAQHHQ